MQVKYTVNSLRLTPVNRQSIRTDGDYVLYWMTAARRLNFNYALQYAAEQAHKLDVGLLVCEPLPCTDDYASERFHRFVLEGMSDNAASAKELDLNYYPWVEEAAGQAAPFFQALSEQACLVVTDDFPVRSHRDQLEQLAGLVDVAVMAVDGNGLLPLALVEKAYPTAYAFRRFLHRALPAFVDERPRENPLEDLVLPAVALPSSVTQNWPAADLNSYLKSDGLKSLPIDHQIEPATQVGGSWSATEQLRVFLEDDLANYAERRNVPDLDATSRLSAYLHYGHISVHQILTELALQESWSSTRLSLKPTGQRSGWWGMTESAEAFLDELITWRELGFGFCARRPDYAEYTSLPQWAQETLNQHAGDERLYRYSYEDFRTAQTHDPLWNAAQRQLLQEGRIHGYLRMLWGKKILEWSPSPQQAMATMLDLNDRFALDGRDPNGYSGISWCLGRFDRPWGPERPIFGKIRYMTSQNTARKVAVKKYLERYSSGQQQLELL